MSLATPCGAWTVADLIAHMNTEHAAICGADHHPQADPRTQFTPIASAWLDYFTAAGDTVLVPKMGATLPTAMVLATHFADMLIHRWDLAVALGRSTGTPEELIAAAYPVADLITDEDSLLVGPGAAYAPALPANPHDDPEQALVCKFGRNPHWLPPTSPAAERFWTQELDHLASDTRGSQR